MIMKRFNKKTNGNMGSNLEINQNYKYEKCCNNNVDFTMGYFESMVFSR